MKYREVLLSQARNMFKQEELSPCKSLYGQSKAINSYISYTWMCRVDGTKPSPLEEEIETMAAKMTSQEKLKKLLKYDPETGIFSRISLGTVPIGRPSGNLIRPYMMAYVNGKNHNLANLAILYVTGKGPRGKVTYIDGDYTNLVYKNLKVVKK